MSSIFGSLGGQNQQSSGGSSLFSGLGGTTSSSQTTPSLFTQTTAQAPGPFSFANSQTPQPAQPAQPGQSSGLFSGLGASTSATQAQQSNTSGLLSGLGQPKPQQQQPGGLFSGLGAPAQAQQSTSGALFSGLGGSTAQAPPAASNLGGSALFGVSQQQNQTQSQEPAAQTAASDNLRSAYFDQILERGKKRNNQENGVLGDLPSLQLGLGDIARKVRNLGTGGPSAQQAQAGAGPYSQPGRAGDSRAHYLLAASGVSTAAAVRDLNTFSAQIGAAVVPGSTARIAETDIESFVSNLQTQSTLDMIQEGLEQSKRDFDSFLEENVQMNWDAQRRRIYEHFGLVKPSQSLDQSTNDSLEQPNRERGAFGRSSRRQRGLGASAASMSFAQSGMAKSVLGTSTMRGTTRGNTFTDLPEKTSSNSLTSGTEDRLQRDKQEKYAEKVRELNVSRIGETCYPVLANFAEAEQEAGIDATASLVNAYKALVSITKEPPQSLQQTDQGSIKERQFVAKYLAETPTSQLSMELRKQIINGSRSCLEEMFKKKINAIIEKDPKVAVIGGVPSEVSTIRGYIRILDNRRELGDASQLQKLSVDGNEDFCWVLIYFLLRCGLVSDAAQYVTENQKAIRSIDRNFTRYMEQYAKSSDRRLPQDLRQHINNEYHSKVRSAPEDSLDPYRMACYKVIGRCELSRRVLDSIRTDEEDWIWLQFALAREVSRTQEMASDVFGLEQIQETIKDIGQRHFSQGSDSPGGFGTFFFLQILAGMFEQAIGWLYPHNHVTAVHFAIALDYYGLLRVADLTATELISYSTRQQPRLHFGLMIGYYTSDFRAAKPDAAADYLSLINLNSDLPGDAGIQQAKMCWEGLRELVLETREFAALLGDLCADGSRHPGAIEKRIKLIRLKDDFAAGKRKTNPAMYDTKSFVDTLIVQAAVAADDSGRTTDAVLLYHLAGEYDNVITIINRTLSEALSVELGQEHMRLEPLKPRAQEASKPQEADNSTLSLTSVDDPLVLAKNMSYLYGQNSLVTQQIKASNREACTLLQQMSEAKALVESSHFMQALDVIQSINILPLQAQGDVNVIRTVAQNFASKPPVVARNVGDLMMWTILCCGKQRDRLRANEWENDTNKQTSESLLLAAQDLMVFAGLIRFRLPPKVFDVLARAGQDFGV